MCAADGLVHGYVLFEYSAKADVAMFEDRKLSAGLAQSCIG